MKHWKRVFAVCCLIFVFCVGGCGAKTEDTPKESTLQEEDEIPENGIILQEDLETVAGREGVVKFYGESEGISYCFTFDTKKIQNPIDQNLKLTFSTDHLEEIKREAGMAADALKITMTGKNLVCIPTLEICLPEKWQSNSAVLVKEQNGKLARMSDVVIQTKENTTLSMQVTSLDGDCYVVGGIVKSQNQKHNNKDVEQTSEEEQGETESGNQPRTEEEYSERQVYGELPTEASGLWEGADAQENSFSSSQENKDESQDSDDKQKEQQTNTSKQNGKEEAKKPSGKKDNICTISIECFTILNHMEELAKEKQEFVPEDGYILAPVQVEYQEGETAFDLLQRICKEQKIPMEASVSPVYHSAYIEGINQLYEFDCGELSGWMFQINGWFPNYSSSQYTISEGDEIRFLYTCDFGKDVGGAGFN